LTDAEFVDLVAFFGGTKMKENYYESIHISRRWPLLQESLPFQCRRRKERTRRRGSSTDESDRIIFRRLTDRIGHQRSNVPEAKVTFQLCRRFEGREVDVDAVATGGTKSHLLKRVDQDVLREADHCVIQMG